MNTLTLAGDYASSFTFVQNDFIDHHMKDINESQIKIYLYLLRSIGGNNQVSVSSIADFFNDSERDVIRALKYLDKQKLIMLEAPPGRFPKRRPQGTPLAYRSCRVLLREVISKNLYM